MNRLGRRFIQHYKADPENIRGLDGAHPAIAEGRTLFPTRVVSPSESGCVLISGKHQRKIGDQVIKGAWAGMPIYTLTLEERKTCPKSCHVYDRCYGNGMPHPHRHAHGDDLIDALRIETAYLGRRHRGGYVVRLHVLGDFYSAAYAAFWSVQLDRIPELRIFGYTAWPLRSVIGTIIAGMNAGFEPRCAIRFSVQKPTGAGMEATTIWRKPEGRTVPEGIVCPATNDGADCCGACGLCWARPARGKVIVFPGHGASFGRRSRALPVQEPKQAVPGTRGRKALSLDEYRGRHAALIATYQLTKSVTETGRIHGKGLAHVYLILKRVEIALLAKRGRPRGAMSGSFGPASAVRHIDPKTGSIKVST